jgi:hypothetical protein
VYENQRYGSRCDSIGENIPIDQNIATAGSIHEYMTGDQNTATMMPYLDARGMPGDLNIAAMALYVYVRTCPEIGIQQ